LPRPEKVAVVNELAEKFRSTRSAILTDYRGLDVTAMTELRRRLREAGVEYRVVKNTLTCLAVRQAEVPELERFLTGPTAIAFGYDDPVVAAKILSAFAREHKVLEIKGGYLMGRTLDVAAVQRLAELPSREELLSQVVGGFQAPIRGLVFVLQGLLRSVVVALDAVRQQKEAAGSL